MKILIEDYNPGWVTRFQTEHKKISGALGFMNPSIDHIGSTSVHGLCAKPKIDILVGLEDEDALDRTIPPMQDAGYTYFKIYEYTMPYRRLFIGLRSSGHNIAPRQINPGEDYIDGETFESVTNIHVMVRGTEHWTRHIAFRDFLREHEQERNTYATLKKELSKRDFKDGLDYNAHKNDFIKEVEQKAVEWYTSKNNDR